MIMGAVKSINDCRKRGEAEVIESMGDVEAGRALIMPCRSGQ